MSSILSFIYSESIPLFIGVRFSAVDLSFYSKGKSWPNLISSTIINTVSAVLFPVMVRYQEDKNLLKGYTRRFISVASYVSFPVMLGFFAISDSFVKVVLTEKWLQSSYYMKIFCCAAMFDILHTGNCETIKAMGRSDIYLIMEIVKKISYFLIIAAFLFFGNSPDVLAISTIVCTIVAIVVNCVPNIKLIGYGVKEQLRDFLPNFIIAVIMCLGVYWMGKLPIDMYLLLFLQILSGVVIYVLCSFLTKNENFYFIIDLLKSLKSRNDIKE